MAKKRGGASKSGGSTGRDVLFRIGVEAHPETSRHIAHLQGSVTDAQKHIATSMKEAGDSLVATSQKTLAAVASAALSETDRLRAGLRDDAAVIGKAYGDAVASVTDQAKRDIAALRRMGGHGGPPSSRPLANDPLAKTSFDLFQEQIGRLSTQVGRLAAAVGERHRPSAVPASVRMHEHETRRREAEQAGIAVEIGSSQLAQMSDQESGESGGVAFEGPGSASLDNLELAFAETVDDMRRRLDRLSDETPGSRMSTSQIKVLRKFGVDTSGPQDPFSLGMNAGDAVRQMRERTDAEKAMLKEREFNLRQSAATERKAEQERLKHREKVLRRHKDIIRREGQFREQWAEKMRNAELANLKQGTAEFRQFMKLKLSEQRKVLTSRQRLVAKFHADVHSAEEKALRQSISAQQRAHAELERMDSRIRSSNDATIERMQGSLESVSRLARGFVGLGLASEENTQKMLQGVVRMQASFDVIVGGTNAILRAVRAWKSYREAVRVAETAQKLQSVMAVESTRASTAQTAALGREAAAANTAAAAHQRLSTARGVSAASSVANATATTGSSMAIGAAGAVGTRAAVGSAAAGGGAGTAGVASAGGVAAPVMAGLAALTGSALAAASALQFVSDVGEFGFMGGSRPGTASDQVGVVAAEAAASALRFSERHMPTARPGSQRNQTLMKMLGFGGLGDTARGIRDITQLLRAGAIGELADSAEALEAAAKQQHSQAAMEAAHAEHNARRLAKEAQNRRHADRAFDSEIQFDISMSGSTDEQLEHSARAMARYRDELQAALQAQEEAARAIARETDNADQTALRKARQDRAAAAQRIVEVEQKILDVKQQQSAMEKAAGQERIANAEQVSRRLESDLRTVQATIEANRRQLETARDRFARMAPDDQQKALAAQEQLDKELALVESTGQTSRDVHERRENREALDKVNAELADATLSAEEGRRRGPDRKQRRTRAGRREFEAQQLEREERVTNLERRRREIKENATVLEHQRRVAAEKAADDRMFLETRGFTFGDDVLHEEAKRRVGAIPQDRLRTAVGALSNQSIEDLAKGGTQSGAEAEAIRNAEIAAKAGVGTSGLLSREEATLRANEELRGELEIQLKDSRQYNVTVEQDFDELRRVLRNEFRQALDEFKRAASEELQQATADIVNQQASVNRRLSRRA